MAALISSDFEIPAEISQGIFEKAQKGSTLAQLSGARPQKFGRQGRNRQPQLHMLLKQ